MIRRECRSLFRERLNARLERAAAFPVVLLAAPAGFGKTVALRDFLANLDDTVVRYDVIHTESSLAAFARGLASAVESVVAGALGTFSDVQRNAGSEHAARELAQWLGEHLRGFDGTIAIDDFHYAAADVAATELLVELIERTSGHVRWIVATRSDAGLPVARWNAYERMDAAIEEHDLRFTPDEARSFARASESDASDDEVIALHELTDGWPVALSIALRTRTRSGDLGSVAAGTRELVYRYLAETVFSGLSDAEAAFVKRTSVVGRFGLNVADAFGASPSFLAELRGRLAFLVESEPGVFRYHDLFRDFAESQLLRDGESAWREAVLSGARELEAEGDLPEALSLYARAQDADAVLRIVSRDGIALFERGFEETLAEALESLPLPRRSSSAAAIGVRAMISAARDRFELAESEFTHAIAEAPDDALRYELVHRYSLELVRRERDCSEVLQIYAANDRVDGALRLPLLGTLATAYVREGRRREALAAVSLALGLLEPGTDDDVRARLFQQFAFVALHSPDRKRAYEYATLAVDLAVSRGLYEIAVRAYSVLYQIAYEDDDDPVAALRILDTLLQCARRGASKQAIVFGLMASYWIEAERGHDDALVRIEAELAAVRGELPRANDEAMQPAKALRAAWSGDFQRAYDLLVRDCAPPPPGDRAAYRAAEVATYALAAGMQDEGSAALSEAGRHLADCLPTRRALGARALVVVAELMRGRQTAAQRHLVELEKSAMHDAPRVSALIRAVRALYRRQLGFNAHAFVPAAIEALQNVHLGGIARLLDVLPFPGSARGAYAALTGAEREILVLLADGASTKQVAARTGRSPRTVDTHIRSISSKLGCRGRHGLVAIAIREGLV